MKLIKGIKFSVRVPNIVVESIKEKIRLDGKGETLSSYLRRLIDEDIKKW